MIDNAIHQSAAPDTQEQLCIVKRNASLIQFLRDPLAFFRSIGRHDGSLAEISLGGRTFYVLSDPSIIRDILTTRGASFEKFPQGNPKQQLFGSGLLTSEGAAQKRQRRMLLPTFHRDRLHDYARQMVACVETLTSSWLSGKPVDIAYEMNQLTLDIIGRTLLGVSDKRVMAKLGGHLHTMLDLAGRFVVPWGNWLMNLPLPSTLRYRRAVRGLHGIISQLIEQARRQPSPDNLVTLLVEARHSDGSALTDAEIRDEIVTMIVAGHETVSVGLSWTLYLLAGQPEMQDELAARVTDVLGQSNPQADDYARLEFLQHTFAEALRLYPPIWILGRRNLDDYTFRNFHASKGSIFLVCMADLHRRASFFNNPDAFEPERWATPDWPAYAFIPFGAGERRCIGERFAWMEAVLVLGCLLRRWRFAPENDKPPTAAAQLTLHPEGPLSLQVTTRLQAFEDNATR